MVKTWWCEQAAHPTCDEYGVGKGITCDCKCHGGKKSSVAEGNWHAVRTGEGVVGSFDLKREALDHLGAHASSRIDTGLYQVSDNEYVVSTDKLEEIL